MPIVMCIEVERQNAKYDKRCEDDLAHTAAMILEERTQSDAKTPRTPKALRAKINADTSVLRELLQFDATSRRFQ